MFVEIADFNMMPLNNQPTRSYNLTAEVISAERHSHRWAGICGIATQSGRDVLVLRLYAEAR